MVSRIEVRGSDCEWYFLKNVMPGVIFVMQDPHPDKKSEAIIVTCDKADSRTDVYRVMEGDYCEQGNALRIYGKDKPDVRLRLGDPHYITSIHPIDSLKNTPLRISHQDCY